MGAGIRLLRDRPGRPACSRSGLPRNRRRRPTSAPRRCGQSQTRRLWSLRVSVGSRTGILAGRYDEQITRVPAGAFDFRSLRPEGTLGRFVESIWYARGTVDYSRERIAPTGSTVAVFVLGDPIMQTPDDGHGEALIATTGLLAGPHDRPVVNEPSGETHAVGIVATPIACEALFQVLPSQVRGRVVDLESAWPDARAHRRRIEVLDDPDLLLSVLADELAPRQTPDESLDRCERAVALLEAEPTRLIGDIADEVGLSHGHLDREFTRIVGLTPRSLARLLRMRRLLDAIDVHRDVAWTDLAADLGWFDQAHLIRDFKRHTGVTPTKYVLAQRGSFSPEESVNASGFVPED